MLKVALLVGVSEYEPGLNPLPGAVKDVDAMREVLLHPEMGGFSESEIILLKNPERQDLEMEIETLFSGRHKDDLVLLYFSGHGIKDDRGRLYLATRTTRKTTQGELIRSTTVSASFIHDRMSESRSRRQVIILDSCFSGAFAEGLSAKDDGTVEIREQLGGEGRVILTSSSSTQYSFEEQGQDLSIYTRFLIQGIRTGEADRDEDEFISMDELHEYASQKVREFQPAMKPEIYAIREGFKIRLAKVPLGDPVQRYRKEVVQFIRRGEISLVGRHLLDAQRSKLGLEVSEVKLIEDEVLAPYRQEFRESLQQYKQVFTEFLERHETITQGDRSDLQNLQQILGLSNEDTILIEEEITAQFKIHQQNLQLTKLHFLEGVSITEVEQIKPQEVSAQYRIEEIYTNVTPNKIEKISNINFPVSNLNKNHQYLLGVEKSLLMRIAPLSLASVGTIGCATFLILAMKSTGDLTNSIASSGTKAIPEFIAYFILYSLLSGIGAVSVWHGIRSWKGLMKSRNSKPSLAETILIKIIAIVLAVVGTIWCACFFVSAFSSLGSFFDSKTVFIVNLAFFVVFLLFSGLGAIGVWYGIRLYKNLP
jgi:hypothetical protein